MSFSSTHFCLHHDHPVSGYHLSSVPLSPKWYLHLLWPSLAVLSTGAEVLSSRSDPFALFTDPCPCICSKSDHVKSSAIILGIKNIQHVLPLPTLFSFTLCHFHTYSLHSHECDLLHCLRAFAHLDPFIIDVSPALFSQFLPHFQLPAQLLLINKIAGFSIQVHLALKNGTSPTTCCFLPRKETELR